MIEYKFNRITWSKTPTWVAYEIWEGEFVGEGEEEHFERQTLLEPADDMQINCTTLECVENYFKKYMHDTYPDKTPVPGQEYVQ